MHVRDPAVHTSKCRRLTRTRSQIGWGLVKGALLGFCTNVIGDASPSSPTHAVIFGMHASNKLMSEASRALLRHMIGTYYRDATRVHENGATFIWERTGTPAHGQGDAMTTTGNSH